MNYKLKMSLTKLNQVATRIHFPLEFSIPKVSLFFLSVSESVHYQSPANMGPDGNPIVLHWRFGKFYLIAIRNDENSESN